MCCQISCQSDPFKAAQTDSRFGFRVVFDRGVLQLYFNVKRWRYRRWAVELAKASQRRSARIERLAELRQNKKPNGGMVVGSGLAG